MPQSTSTHRQTPGYEPAAAAEDREQLTAEIRNAMYLRGLALARWQAHRHTCPMCRVIAPPGQLPAACFTGRPVLARLHAASRQVNKARQALRPAAPEQPTLF